MPLCAVAHYRIRTLLSCAKIVSPLFACTYALYARSTALVNRIPAALKALEESSLPWVQRASVETLLGVRRRRAQQILTQLVTEKRGRMVVVEKTALIEHLRWRPAKPLFYEQRRRQRLRELLEKDRRPEPGGI